MAHHFIGNTAVPPASGASLPLIDPATGQAFAQIARGNAADVDRAVQSARHGFDQHWQAMPAVERGRLLMKLSVAVSAHASELAAIEQRDCGKPASQALADAQALARYFEFYAGAADKLHGETLPYLNLNPAVTLPLEAPAEASEAR